VKQYIADGGSVFPQDVPPRQPGAITHKSTLLRCTVLECHRLEMGCISKRDGSTREPYIPVRRSEMQRNTPQFKLLSGVTKFPAERRNTNRTKEEERIGKRSVTLS
jgi:hypothetical protein